jgi:hypothetical protein
MARQQCPLCGAFLSRPRPGASSRRCSRCGTEFEVPPPIGPPTPDQDRALDALCLEHGGWACADPQADGTVRATVEGGDRFTVNTDGSVLDQQTNDLHPPGYYECDGAPT